MSIKLLSSLLLAAAFSLAAQAAQAIVQPGHGGEVRAAPACGSKCPVLAGGASGAGGDIRASLTDRGRSGQVPSLWRPMLASEEGLGSAGDQSGRGATGGRGGISGEV